MVYTFDALRYKGGAHVATFNQIELLHRKHGAEMTVVALDEPTDTLWARFPYVRFVTPSSVGWTKRIIAAAPKKRLMRKLLSVVAPGDTVCVPFENSVFRPHVARLECRRKIQWVHIDYARWRKVNLYTRLASANDGALYRRFDCIVFVSQEGRDGFVALFPHLREKCMVCNNWLDTRKILGMAAMPLPQVFPERAGLRLITVARLDTAQKGIDRCLQAAAMLKQAGCAFSWMFVGTGNDEQHLKAMASRLGLDDVVIWAGHTANPYALVRGADVLCLFSHYEGIANTVYEALIAGTPVMATEVSGIHEQLGTAYGQIVENSLQGIYRGLKLTIDDPGWLRQAGDALKTYQYDNDTVEQTVDAVFGFAPGTAGEEAAREALPAVSVIVPVYNVQAYLDECLSSLVKQTLQAIEVLVVNDGSTDESGKVIDDYTARYPQKVRRLDKENGGLGDARNYGLRHARGAYVAFIDGDDYVQPDMMARMLDAATKTGCEIVLADLYGFDNATGYTVVERCPFEKKEGFLDHALLMQYSTRPVVVSACTKLYRASLFQSFSFPLTWYEDMGLIPILYSYVDAVYYLPAPLYHYRWNRSGSIQSQKKSSRTLEIITSKQRILNDCNPAFLPQAAFAVYDHCCRFLKDQPQYTEATLEFVKQNAAFFAENPMIAPEIEQGKMPDLLPKEPLIPKIIHFCWFGGGPKSGAVAMCRASWEKYLPGYTFMEWTEQNCDMNENPFVRTAYAQKKWAYVADYFRFKALYEYGGVYMDTDVLLHAPLDSLLCNQAFFAIETYLFAHGGIIGAVPHAQVIEKMRAAYRHGQYRPAGSKTICHRITDVLMRDYAFQMTGLFQMLPGGIAVYPPNRLTVDVGDGACIAEHLYDGSWMDAADRRTFKYEVLKDYFSNPYAADANPNALGGLAAGNPAPNAVVDEVILRYGVVFVARGVAKRVIKVLFPARLLRFFGRKANGKG